MASEQASSESNPEASSTAEGKTPSEWYRYWEKENAAAQKRLRKFTKQGHKVVERFLDERGGQNDQQSFEGFRGDTPSRLNLFHTNVRTQQAMLYGSVPQVEVSREHQDPDDDIARVASLLYQRILQSDVSASGKDFATALKAALLDRLLPGLGTARVYYEFDSEESTVVDFETQEETVTEEMTGERSRIGYVHWQDFRWGWARTWAEVPWLGYRSFMTKEEASDRFGPEKAGNLEYKNQMPTSQNKMDGGQDKFQENNVQKAEIWEFWHKFEKKVFWWSQGADLILDAKDDPLQLNGFWPSPMPMMANLTTQLFVPKADFVIAQDLYNEIDVLQSRISSITRACKVVGVYDENATGISRMFKEGIENDLIPVSNWAMFAEKGGIAGAIDWLPIADIAAVLSNLRSLLGETIELLYQVTGMSDILRGANTDQYTSDGTNQLKAKFGSIRVQALQDEFARFASDLEELKAEVIGRHYEPNSIVVQANAEFLPEADRDKIGEAIQLMQSPDVKWRVDIRPESIAMVDYAQLKSERTEYMTAIATFLQSGQAMLSVVPESLPVLLEFLKWGMAGFKGANYLEGIMDQAIEQAKNAPPKPKDDGAAKAAKELEDTKHQHAMELMQAKSQATLEAQQAKSSSDMQLEQAQFQTSMQEEQQQHQAEMQKIQTSLQADLAEIAAKLDSALLVERAQSAYAIEEEEVQHKNEMSEKEKDGQMAAVQQDRETDTD